LRPLSVGASPCPGVRSLNSECGLRMCARAFAEVVAQYVPLDLDPRPSTITRKP